MTDEQMRELVRTWDRAGPALEAVKRRALESMTDADVRAHVEALFTGWYPAELALKRECGLVEQQRWFAKAHRKP